MHGSYGDPLIPGSQELEERATKVLHVDPGSNPTSLLLGNAQGQGAERIRVMTFNLWHGGEAGHQPLSQTAAEAVTEDRKARGGQVERLLKDLKPVLGSGATVFLTGDFNEPSHLDWTARAAAAGLCPLAVEYPSTRAVMDAYPSDHRGVVATLELVTTSKPGSGR